ncbi:MAG: T9SS type A sorting domain-containing protein [Saprospiraceae bacterium]
MVHRFFMLRSWAFLVLCFPLLLSAQGWQRFYGGTGDDRTFAVRLLPDGGLVAAGSTSDSVGGMTDWYFLKTDSAGNVLAERTWGSPDTSEYTVSMVALGSQILATGTLFYPYPGPSGLNQRASIAWNLLDYQGNIVGAGSADEFISQALSAIDFAGRYLIVGANYLPYFDSQFPHPHFVLLDAAGVQLWEATFPVTQYGEAIAAVQVDSQTVVATGWELTENNASDIFLQKINGAGQSVDEHKIQLSTNEQPASVLKMPNGNLSVVARINGAAFLPDIFLLSINPATLDTLWTRIIHIPGWQQPHAALALTNGNIAIVGEHIPEGSTSRDGFLALTDSLGNLLWFKTYGGIKGDIFWDLQAAPDGNGFVIAGQTASFSPDGDLQAWLLRTDSLGTVWSNRVIGRVLRDEIENCVEDPSEPPLPGWLVTASGEPGILYTLTDSSGGYSMEVDTGAWFLSVLPPSGYWSPCEDSVEVYIQQLGDTLAVDLPVQAVYDCPLLDVDLTTPYLRRCFENTYSVRYFNYGTAAAPNALISIELDPYLTPTGSTLPYTQSGDTLFFSVGQVASLAGGNFQFTALLDCDSTVLGQTHCAEAHIFPDSLCFELSPEWDGAHLEVDGICMGDSVLLTVTNTGMGMQGTVSFIIAEDQIIFKFSSLQLAAGQDTTFVLHPGGSTVTFIVQQTPGHPGNNQPMLVIEGCGGFPFSTGFAFQFPQNDGDFSTDIECRQSIGSFDPNDKTGLPEGVGEQHVIAPETAIEYLIRFQNTGTDTAFRVEIRDTLPLSLDLATFREGASSHPYRLEINGFGVLGFLFDPIALPDSAANWAASQGFVKFRISPKKGIALGTAIENRAAIYFDQNLPIITAQTLHTLGDPFQHLITPATEPINTNTTVVTLSPSPNPTHGNISVNLAQPLESGGLRLGVRDALGTWRDLTTFSRQASGSTLNLDLSHLPAGVYFLELTNSEGKVLARGKVLKI